MIIGLNNIKFKSTKECYFEIVSIQILIFIIKRTHRKLNDQFNNSLFYIFKGTDVSLIT